MLIRWNRLRKTVLSVLVEIPLILLSHLVTRKRQLWVFLPMHFEDSPYNGNIRYLFEYVLTHHPEIECWCLGVRQAILYVPEHMSRRMTFRRYTPRNVWRILRSEYLFVDGQTRLSLGRFRLVQLWHGTGFKNIASRVGNHQSLFERFRRGDSRADIVIASSEADRARKAASFRAGEVLVTGSPRNDVLQSMTQQSIRSLKQELGLPHDRTIVCYAPTFRDTGHFEPFTTRFWSDLNALCRDRNYVFAVKKHPADINLEVPDSLSNIFDVSSRVKDIQSFLAIPDILVSDYSGIVTDFAILRRPIVFYTYDMRDYVVSCRDFYYDIEAVLPGPFARTDIELLRYLRDLSWFNEPSYAERFENFRRMFQAFSDGQSSRRVTELLISRE